jgi:hypothetical protein
MNLGGCAEAEEDEAPSGLTLPPPPPPKIALGEKEVSCWISSRETAAAAGPERVTAAAAGGREQCFCFGILSWWCCCCLGRRRRKRSAGRLSLDKLAADQCVRSGSEAARYANERAH